MVRTQEPAHWPLQTGTFTAARQVCLPVIGNLAHKRFFVAVLFVLLVALLSCLAPTAQPAPGPGQTSSPALDSQDWAPARLAREAPLEIVIIKPEGSCPQGFLSAFNFYLGAQESPDFLRVCADASALVIFPRIWSGSDGTDLVIKGQRSCLPIAILINDSGDGLGDVEFDPRSHSPRIRSRRMPAQNKQQIFIFRARRTHRSLIDLTAGCRFCGVTVLGRSPPLSPDEFQQNDTVNSQNRGPPSSIPQQIS